MPCPVLPTPCRLSLAFCLTRRPTDQKSLFSKPCPVASRASSILTGRAQESTLCGHCDRKVEILADKSLLEVAAFMKANPDACIVIDGRLGLQGGGPADAGLTGLGWWYHLGDLLGRLSSCC